MAGDDFAGDDERRDWEKHECKWIFPAGASLVVFILPFKKNKNNQKNAYMVYPNELDKDNHLTRKPSAPSFRQRMGSLMATRPPTAVIVCVERAGVNNKLRFLFDTNFVRVQAAPTRRCGSDTPNVDWPNM